MSVDHTASDDDFDDDDAPKKKRVKKAAPASVYAASELVGLLKEFSAQNPNDWLQQIRRDTSIELGPLKIKEWGALLKKGDLAGWEKYVPKDERDAPPLIFSEFAQMALPKTKGASTQKSTGWEPDPNFTVQFSTTAVAPHRQEEPKTYPTASPRKTVAPKKATRPIKVKGKFDDIEPRDSADREAEELDELIKKELPFAASPKKAVRKYFKSAASKKVAVKGPTPPPIEIPVAEPEPPLSLFKIAQAIEETLKREPDAELKGLVKYCQLANEAIWTWEEIQDSITHQKNGLTKENCRYPWLGMIRQYCVPLPTLDEAADSIAATYKAADRMCGLEGMIEHGALAPRKMAWEKLRSMLHEGLIVHNGVPVKYKNMDALIADTVMKISPKMLRSSVKATYKATGSRVLNGRIRHGDMAAAPHTWLLARNYADNKTNGLTAKNFPHDTFSDYIKNKILYCPPEDVLDSIRKESKHTKNGRVNFRSKDPIKYGKAADGVRTWPVVRGNMDRHANGMENCPYNSPGALAEAEDAFEGLPDFDLKEIEEASLQHNAKYDGWPQFDDDVEHPGLRKKTKKWHSVHNAIRYKRRGITEENCPEMSLKKYLIRLGHATEEVNYRPRPQEPAPA